MMNDLTVSKDDSTTESTPQYRAQFIKQMASDAWSAYERHAWGDEALQPVTSDSYEYWYGCKSGHMIVCSLSTLWVMGLDEQFDRGKRWVEEELSLNNFVRENFVHRTTHDYVGGLLSCYALTGEKVFLDKAREIADALEPLYQTRTGLPYMAIDFNDKFVSGSMPYLSHILSGTLEYQYLSRVTGDDKYHARIDKILQFIREKFRMNKLVLDRFDVESGRMVGTPRASFYEDAREFFFGPLRLYILSGGHDVDGLNLYRKSIKEARRVGMFVRSRTRLAYVRDYDYGSDSVEDFMDYSECYLGALLSLGAEAMKREVEKSDGAGELYTASKKQTMQKCIEDDLLWAKDITETGHQASVRTATGLPPDGFYFNDKEDATNLGNDDKMPEKDYKLGSELAESYFTLWRITHDPKYRDYAWEMAQAIQKHCRVTEGDGPGGYSGIVDVDQVPTKKYNIQAPRLLAGTLKYLYLTFTDDSVLPLDKWVFNSAGHPFPVISN